MRAVIYCRVSTERQAKENDSLEFQRKACLDYCKRQGYEVAETFMEEGESAKSADRTEFKRMLRYCALNKGQVQVVVVYSLSRFSRNTLDHKNIRLALLTQGITLRSVSEPIDDTAEGELFEDICSAFAQYDNRQRARRTVAGMRNKLERGGWSFKAPLGYRNTLTGNGKKTIVPDSERAELIREAFEMYATGDHTKESVLRLITKKGLTTLHGKKLSKETFNRLLRNPLYAGMVKVSCWDVGQKGDFEAIISYELYERVQALLSGRKPTTTLHRRHNPDFPLRHFVRCGNCNKPLTGSWSKGRQIKYAYYHCQRTDCKARVSVRKEKMEALFVEFLRQFKPRPEYLRLFRAVVLDVWHKKQTAAADERVRLQQNLQKLRERKFKLNEAFVYQQTVSKQDYEDLKANLETDITLKEMELNEARDSELDVKAAISFAEHVFLDAPRLWQEMSPDQKQRFQQVLFPDGVQFSDDSYQTTKTSLLFNEIGTLAVEKEGLVGLMSLQYTIRVSKDHAQVTANWDIKVDMSDAELISNFTLTVEGVPMNTQCSGGNKACNGAAYATLSDPTADSPVTFVITTNKPDVRNGSDILRGEKTYDDATFSG